ncbi:MAG: alpha/beta hydrolase [Thermoplasmata archaeon]|nr:alpha/beta hydrolase [Thermoplasmata archaeon]
MPKLSCAGFELHYELVGAGGEAVALVHGAWADRHQWDAVATKIAASHRVISYARRGHGESHAPGRPMFLADHVADLSSLIAIVGRGPVHLVGSGTGGVIALELALRRPDQVRSVNLHEPPLAGLLAGDPEYDGLHASFRGLEDRFGRQLRAGDRAAGAQTLANGVSAEPGGWAELPPAMQAAMIANVPATLHEAEDPAFEIMETSRFAGYREPIVLTAGSRSAPAFAAINDRLAAAFYGVLRYAFDGAGHFPHVTHPDQFDRVVEEFCQFASQR